MKNSVSKKSKLESFDFIIQQSPTATAKLGIVLGSGLGEIAAEIENRISFNYKDLPGFPVPSIEGHSGQLHLGTLNNIPVACLQGRVHLYEGMVNENIKTLIRTLKLLGCEKILITNSSGSMRKEMTPGELVMITDHINLQFSNVLLGPNDESFGERFIDMSETYDLSLRNQLQIAAKELNIKLHEGVYLGALGPSFETPAEIRAFQFLGGDIVGMSTIPEVITARHCNMKIAAIAVVTNMAAGLSPQLLSHQETLENAKLASQQLIRLIKQFCNNMHHTPQEND